MKIVTKANLKDYYDSSSDPTEKQTVWVRTPQTIDRRTYTGNILNDSSTGASFSSGRWEPNKEHFVLNAKDTKVEGLSSRYLQHSYGSYGKGSSRRFAYASVYVVFCGKLYRGIRYTEAAFVEGKVGDKGSERVYWTKEAFQEHHRINAEVKVHRWRDHSDPKDLLIQLEAYFKVDDHKRYAQICVDENTPILSRFAEWIRPDYHEWFWEKNGLLKKDEFYRVFNAHEAFQELSMFVGGVLVRQEKIAPMSDKLKVKSHGMDEMSFRKAPTKVHT